MQRDRRDRRERRKDTSGRQTTIAVVVVLGLVGALIVGVLAMSKSGDRDLPNLNDELAAGRLKFDDPALAGKTYKGHGIAEPGGGGVDHSVVYVWVTDYGRIALRWNHDNGAAPPPRVRINFKCRFIEKKRGPGGLYPDYIGEMLSWSRR